MKAGDKVVCVENGTTSGGYSVYKGSYYRISDSYEFFGKYAVEIEGCPCIWDAERFRKIEPAFTNALTKELADDFIEQDSEVVEVEKELTEQNY